MTINQTLVFREGNAYIIYYNTYNMKLKVINEYNCEGNNLDLLYWLTWKMLTKSSYNHQGVHSSFNSKSLSF